MTGSRTRSNIKIPKTELESKMNMRLNKLKYKTVNSNINELEHQDEFINFKLIFQQYFYASNKINH